MKPKIEIYTDGGCEPNPGPGGFGVVLLHPKKRREVSGGFRLTTNNRMELMAVIRGLELLKESCEVRLYSDSNYVVQAMTLGWAKGWKKKGWWRKSERVPNADLWERLLALCEKHKVEFVWVRGHAGTVENECCDRLSTAALKAANLAIDEGYENVPEGGGVRQKPRAGEPCWSCGTAVVKRSRRPKPGQEVFQEFFMQCPKCNAIYELDEAKAVVAKTPSML